MTGLLRISDAAAMGLHAAALFAARPSRRFSVKAAAAFLRVSEAHLSKVLQRLARAGLIESARGFGGGFRLGREPSAITLLEVYEAVDGALSPRSCLMRRPLCRGESCLLGGLLSTVNRLVSERLGRTTLADLAGTFEPLLGELERT